MDSSHYPVCKLNITETIKNIRFQNKNEVFRRLANLHATMAK